MIKLLIVVLFVLSTILFKKAAGTLNIGKINIISCIYYIFMLQSFAGASLIFVGYDEHYTLNYLLNRERSCTIVAVVVWLVAVFFPLFVLFYQYVFGINMREKYTDYLRRKVEVEEVPFFQPLFMMISGFCLMLLIGFLIKIGYIPVVNLFFAPDNFDYALERARIGSTFFIHPYITNILVLMLVPLLSYISFAYFMKARTKKWAVLTGILFIASVIVKTYKFEKSQLIFYFAVFVLIYAYYKGGIRSIYMMIIAILMAMVIIVFYFRQGFTGSVLDMYNGPLGRTLFTEVGTLAYCFDMFPHIFGFLEGRSFTPTVLRLLGRSSEEYLRSSKLTMAFYGSEKVYDGGAGVMNTLFVGEAYANWGYIGVIVSVIWVAFIVTLFTYLFLRLKKTPSTVVLSAFLTIKFALLLEGGFCDFVYNFDTICTVAFVLGIYFCFERRGKLLDKMVQHWERLKGKI